MSEQRIIDIQQEWDDGYTLTDSQVNALFREINSLRKERERYKRVFDVVEVAILQDEELFYLDDILEPIAEEFAALSEEGTPQEKMVTALRKLKKMEDKSIVALLSKVTALRKEREQIIEKHHVALSMAGSYVKSERYEEALAVLQVALNDNAALSEEGEK